MLTVEQLKDLLREGSLVTNRDAWTLAERVHAAIEARQQDALDARRLDYLEALRLKGQGRGLMWDGWHFDTDKPIRDQIDAAIAKGEQSHE